MGGLVHQFGGNIMRSEWLCYQMASNGAIMGNTRRELARVAGDPGLIEGAEAIGKVIKDVLGANYSGAVADAAQAIFSGSSKAYMAVDTLKMPLSVAGIYMHFVAWSEDDLKSETCLVVSGGLPAHARLINEWRGKKRYDVIYELPRSAMVEGERYVFIAGAQDDGWFFDVAATSRADIFLGD
jgi:hypothetical protein